MLETIREYAWERLAASGEEAELRQREALFVLDLAEVAMQAAEEGGDQIELYARIGAEVDNVRSALEWARDERENDALPRLVAAVNRVWTNRGHYEELDKWLSLALERAESPVGARMSVLRAATGRAMYSGDYARADELIAEWRSLAEQAGDENQVLTALNSEALNAAERGEVDHARAQFNVIRDRARAAGDRDRLAAATVNLGLVAMYSADWEAGLAYATKGVDLFRELGDDGGVATALINCGVSALPLSDPARSEEAFRQALAIADGLGWKRGVVLAVSGVAAALVARHQEERGVELLAAAASLRDELGVDLGWEEMRERAHADAKATLGEEAFAAAWARGQAIVPEEIVAFTMRS
jgi:tetratricopeptide (TPR) repeat protein